MTPPPLIPCLAALGAAAPAFVSLAQEQITAEQWREDLSVFTEQMEALHYDLFGAISQEEWTASVERLHSRIPTLQPHEIIIEFMRLAVMVGDGHTVVVPPFDGPHRFHNYPVEFYLYEDGLFVRAAAPELLDLVGKRVVEVGGRTVDDLLPLVASVFPHDNEMGVMWGLEFVLRSAETMHALGVAQSPDRLEIMLEDGAGTRSPTVLSNPVPVTADDLVEMVFVGARPDWPSMRNPGVEAPAWRRQLDEPYWSEFVEEDNLVHLHFNQVRTGAHFPAFVDALFATIEERDADGLIVDLRSNEGGDLTMLRPFIVRLIGDERINQEGRLFIAVGRRTFSAAGYLAARLELYTEALFVGEPMGTRPNFVGETSDPFQLPNSGLWVNPSTLYWQGGYAADGRLWIEPDIPAPLRSEHEREGRDPVLEAIRAYRDQ